MKKLFSILAVLLVATVTEATAQSFKVIVNPANSTDSISEKDLSDIFLKNKKNWADGSSTQPIDLNSNSATREAFSKQVHGRDIGAIRSYWQQAAFSGAGTAPLERSSDAEVIEFVKNNPGAVGYISSAADTPGVKVLSIE